MTIAHDWPDEQDATRCIYCGTTKAMHNATPQNCVPRHNEIQPQRPTHTGHSDFAADDQETIYRRIMELEAERVAIMNRPAEPD